MPESSVPPSPQPGSAQRFGYIVSQYPAVNHTFILREILGLRERGCDVKVVSIRQPDRKPEAFSPDEASEYRQTYSILGAGAASILMTQIAVFLSRPVSYLSTLFSAWKLAPPGVKNWLLHTVYFFEAACAGRHLHSQGIRYVHTHFSSTVTLLAARLYGMKFSMTIHGPDEFNDVIGFGMAAKVAEAEFVSAISNYCASQVMRASDPEHWHKLRVFRLGVNPDEHSIRAEPSLNEGAFQLLTVGRLAAAKAQHLLIAAVKLLVGQGRRVQLTLVGDGPNRKSLEAMVEREGLAGSVVLTGSVSHHKVADYYRKTHVFVMGSFAEGVPVVLMEAMAMGVPCVSTWIMGIPELIEHDVDGLLIPPADPKAIADAIARLMDDPALRERLGKASREKVKAKYNNSKNVAALCEALEDVSARA